MANKLVRLFNLALYYGIARNLPEHSDPRGKLWKWLRATSAKPLLRTCGVGLTLNRGAHFGNGTNWAVGDHCGLGMNSRVIGQVTFGNYVGTAQEVFICAYNRAYNDFSTPMMFQGGKPDKPIVIDDDVMLMARSIILAGVHIHTGCVIGAGAVVTRDVPPYSIVSGNPARVIKFRKPPPKGMDFSRMIPIDCPIPVEEP